MKGCRGPSRQRRCGEVRAGDGDAVKPDADGPDPWGDAVTAVGAKRRRQSGLGGDGAARMGGGNGAAHVGGGDVVVADEVDGLMQTGRSPNVTKVSPESAWRGS